MRTEKTVAAGEPVPKWKTWAKVGLSAAVLAALFWILPWADLKASFGSVRGAVWLTVLGAFLGGHVLGALKWWTMLSAVGVRLSLRDALRWYAAGLFANLCLPGIVGGDVVRATLAVRGAGRPEAVVLGSLADRGLDVAALAAVIAGGAAIVGTQLSSGLLQTGLWLLASGLGLAGLAAAALLRMPAARLPRSLRGRVRRVQVATRRLAQRPWRAALCFGCAVAIQGGFAALNGWIGVSIGVAVPFATWMVVWPLAKLAGLLPVSLGGLGVRDATLGALLATFGAKVSEGVVTSLVWQSVLIAGGLLAGGFWWSMSHLGKRNETGIEKWTVRGS